MIRDKISNSLLSFYSALSSTSTSMFKVYLYGFFLYVASILITGYAVYAVNQSLQIPLVYWLNNPSLYPHDPFAETLRYYASTIWYIVALANRVLPLESLLFGLFLLERLLVIFAAGYLAHTFAPKSKLAVVGAMAVFALGLAGPDLGENLLVLNYFEQTGLSIPFFLLAFAAFYRKNPWLVALWTAFGFNCNSMFGVYALTYLGAAFLLDGNYRCYWKKWLLAFGLFVLLASPGISLTISAFFRQAFDSHLWYTASQVRFPHHLFPLTWNKINFVKYGILNFFLLILLFQHKDKFKQLFTSCSIWAAISFSWLIYSFIAAYVTKSPSMLVMHPGRGVTLWYGVAIIALISICAVKFETTEGRQQKAFLLCVFLSSIFIWHPLIGPYILAASLIAFALQPIWYCLLDGESANRIALLLTFSILLVGIIHFQVEWEKTKHLKAAIINEPPVVIQEIATWSKKNTSIDSVFLVNWGWNKWQYFRALSQRPVFTSWKDGSAILWDRTFIKPWVERLQAIGLDMNEPGLDSHKAASKLNQLYRQLRDSDVENLKSRYRLAYWVVPVQHPSNLPVVFQNQAFKVLNLNSGKN